MVSHMRTMKKMALRAYAANREGQLSRRQHFKQMKNLDFQSFEIDIFYSAWVSSAF